MKKLLCVTDWKKGFPFRKTTLKPQVFNMFPGGFRRGSWSIPLVSYMGKWLRSVSQYSWSLETHGYLGFLCVSLWNHQVFICFRRESMRKINFPQESVFWKLDVSMFLETLKSECSSFHKFTESTSFHMVPFFGVLIETTNFRKCKHGELIERLTSSFRMVSYCVYNHTFISLIH